MAIATLTIDIVAKLANIERDLDRVAQASEASALRMQQAFGAIKSLIPAGAVLSAVAALGQMTKAGIDAADAVAQLSQKTGIAAEDLSKYQYAAGIADVSSESLAGSLAKLARTLDEAKSGSKEAADAFARLKLNPAQFTSTQQAFEAIATATAGMGDGYEKVAALQGVFGKSAADLIPLLNGGAEGLRAMGDEAERFGLVVSGRTAEAADQLNDDLARMQAQVDGLRVGLASELLPILVEVSKGFISTGESGQKASGVVDALAVALETAVVLGANVAYVVRAIGIEIGGVAAQAGALASLDFDAFKVIGDEMRADAEAARKEIDAFSDRILNARNNATALAQAGKTLPPSIAAYAKGWEFAAGAADQAAKSTRNAARAADDFARVYGRMQAQNAGLDANFFQDLRALESGWRKGRIGLDEYRAAVDKLTKSQQFYQDQVREQEAATRDAEKAQSDYYDTWSKYLGDLDKEASGIEEQVRLYGLTNAQIAESVALRAEETLQKARAAGVDADYLQLLEREVEARRRIAAAAQDLEQREVASEEAKKAADEWSRAAEQVEQSLTDALMRSFESGKDFGKTFVDSLKNLLKTSALRVLVQPVVGQISGAIAGLGGSGSALAGQGGGLGGLGSIGQIGGLLGNLGGLGGTVGSFLGASAGGTAGGLIGGFNAALGGNTLGAISSGLSGAANGFVASGLGQAIGAAAPWAAAAFAVYQIVDGLQKRGGPKSGGEAWSGRQAWDLFTPADSDAQVRGIVTSIDKTLQEAATALGGSAAGITLGLGFDTDPRGDAQNRVKAFGYDASGRSIYSVMDKEIGRDAATLQTELSTQSARLLLAGLKASNLDAEFADYFAKLDVGTLTEEQANAAVQSALALKQVGTAVADLYASIGQSARLGDLTSRQALANAFGGLDALVAGVSGAYDALLTEQQKLDNTNRALAESFAKLGVAVPGTNAALLAMIEAQDLTTEAGQRAYATLVQLAPAFAQVSAAGDAAAEAARQAAERAAAAEADRLASLASTRRDLEIQLMETLGDAAGATAARRADQLAGLDASLRPLLEQIFAAEDAAAAAKAAEQAAEATRSAAEEQARAQESLRSGWQAIADDIAGTVRSLRGQINPAAGSVFAQAEFATATAAARAGDQQAAQRLPELARAVVDAGKAMSATGEEQALLVARTAASIEETLRTLGRYGITVPAFADGGLHAGGLRIVGERGPELEATGPARIVSTQDLGGLLRGDVLAAGVKVLAEEVTRLRAENERISQILSAIAGHTAKTARRLDAVTPDGDAIQTRPAT